MTSTEFEGFVSYAAGLCFLMAALNTWLVYKRGRSWGMVGACILTGATLEMAHHGAERPLLIAGGAGVFVCLAWDMVHRAGAPKSGGPTA